MYHLNGEDPPVTEAETPPDESGPEAVSEIVAPIDTFFDMVTAGHDEFPFPFIVALIVAEPLYPLALVKVLVALEAEENVAAVEGVIDQVTVVPEGTITL